MRLMRPPTRIWCRGRRSGSLEYAVDVLLGSVIMIYEGVFVRVVLFVYLCKDTFFFHTAKPHSLYLTSTEASAALSPRAVARILRVPGVFARFVL